MKQIIPFLLFLLPLCSAQSENPVQVTRDLVFFEHEGQAHKIDLHMPEGVQHPPLLMFIHGGGWRNGDRTRCRLAWVAKHGYAVASVEYRLSHEGIFPAQIHDCKGALRWLRANAEKFGYNAERVVVGGTSAGGHLAALMGTSGDVKELEGDSGGHPDQSSRVQGVIDYYGPSNFVLRSKTQGHKTDQPTGSVYKLLGGAVTKNVPLAKLASPVSHISKDDPPLLILHGDKDPIVEVAQSHHLVERYEAGGLDVHLHIAHGQGHGWKTNDAEQKKILAFMSRITKGTSTSED